MEDQEDWLVLLCSNGILNILLMLAEKLGVELDVTGFVNTVDVTEPGSDGEVWGNWGESFVDGKDILGLRVERVVVNILVVNTILLATSDTDLLKLKSETSFNSLNFKAVTYHLKPLLHRGRTL